MKHKGDPVGYTVRKIQKRNMSYGEFRQSREDNRAVEVIPESLYLFAEKHGVETALFRVTSKFVW